MSAICEYEFADPRILHLQRMSPLTGRAAATTWPVQCPEWAVQVRPSNSHVSLVYSACVSSAKQCQNVLAVVDTSTTAVRQEKADDAVDRR